MQTDWLGDDFGKRLSKIREHVSNKWNGELTIKWYTPHGKAHSEAVEGQLHQLIPDDRYKQLNETERFLLLASSWLHDLGMIPNLFGSRPTDDVVRDKHHERTAKYIREKENELSISNQESEILQEICLHHRKREDINKCPQTMNVGKDSVRVRLLASYLRLADALHIDATRSDEYLYKIYLMTNIPREEKFHWVKSRSINAIVPSADDMNIVVKMRIPEDWAKSKVTPLLEIIVEDIQEELDTVKNILIRGQISMFLEVVPDIEQTKVVRADHEQIKDLEDIMSNIELLRSPNASKIIEVVLDNIIAMCELPAEHAIQRLIEYEKTLLDNVFIQKSCHVGLRTILEILKIRLQVARKISVEHSENEQVRKDIKNEAQRMKRERIEAKNNIKENARPMLQDAKSIMLYGYSDSVLAALDCLATPFKEKITIYVCECRNKTRYDHENKLVYSDAIHYAVNVQKLGYVNVTIISDSTVANLMSRGKVDKVLLGANGVDKDYMVGHTVGHLAVADLAQLYCVAVYVIVEYLKFGDFEHKPDLERDNEWLTTVSQLKEQLSETGIRILNLREDIVPPNKIDMFITDVGNFHSRNIDRIARL